MELPRKILIGSAVIVGLGDFIQQLDQSFSRVAFISGKIVKERTQVISQKSMKDADLGDYKWFVAAEATIDEAEKLAENTSEVFS